MKKHDASMIKKGILLSLMLLSPEILAATENLNFKYSRADALSLDPRVGIQARACHSLGDPINISFRLGKLENTPNIILSINGKSYSKSYSVFSGEKGKANSGVDNTSLSIPFNITKSGSASGTSGVMITPTPVVSFNDPFCFNKKRMANLPLTEGYIPLIKGDSKTGKDYDKFCHEDGLATQDMVWNGDPRVVPMPDYIKKWGSDYWTSTTFYMTLTNTTGAKPVLNWVDFNRKPDEDGKVVSGMTDYSLPVKHNLSVGPEKAYSVLEHGDFSFELSNRNITELKVSIDDGRYIWEWTPSTDNPNILHLRYSGIDEAFKLITAIPNNPSAPVYPGDKNPPNPAKNDPYVKNGFYAKDNFYKGTLAGKGDLNQKYQDYVQNIVPLSLPPDSVGDINLVNTDSLSFTLRNVANNSPYGYMQLSIYGQPIQFGPLKYRDKEVASAMQVRNACY